MVDLSKLHPKVAKLALELVEKASEKGLRIAITQGYRSIEEQNALWEQGRTKPGVIVTNAEGGQSYHQFHVAFDIAIIGKDGKITWNTKSDINDDHVPDYTEVGLLGESLGLTWGGRWHFCDLPHYQYTEGITLAQFQMGKTLPNNIA